MTSIRSPTQKVILCGEYGVGKSSLFRRFSSDCFVASTDRRSTLGLDHVTRVFQVDSGSGQREMKLQLWDTGGMERVASVTSSYYKFAEAAILVFALDNIDSFNMLSQHLLEIVTHAEHARIFVCGNKVDLQHSIAVTDSDIEMLCEQCHNLVAGTFKTSCRTSEGVQQMFASIAQQLSLSSRSSRYALTQFTDAENAAAFQVSASRTNNSDNCSC